MGKYFENFAFVIGFSILVSLPISTKIIWRTMVEDIGFKTGLAIVLCFLTVGILCIIKGVIRLRASKKGD